MKIRFIFLIALGLSFVGNLSAQYRITRIGKNQNLESSALGIWQDSEGWIWVAGPKGFTRVNRNQVNNFHSSGMIFYYGNFIYLKKDIFYFEAGSFDRTNYKLSDTLTISDPWVNCGGDLILHGVKEFGQFGFGGGATNSYTYLNKMARITGLVNFEGDTLIFENHPLLSALDYSLNNIWYSINLDTVLARNRISFRNQEKSEEIIFWTDHRGAIASKYKFSEENFAILSKDTAFYFGSDLVPHLLNTKKFESIIQINKTDDDRFFLIATDYPEMLEIEKSGEIIQRYDLFDNSLPWDCKIHVTNHSVYFSNKNSLYNIDSGITKLLTYDKFLQTYRVENSLFFTALIEDETWLFECLDGQIRKLDQITKQDGTLCGGLKDSENIIWLLFTNNLFKLEPSSVDYYQFENKFDDPFNYGKSEVRRERFNRIFCTRNGQVTINHYNQDSCIVEQHFNSTTKSITLSGGLVFLGTINDSLYFFRNDLGNNDRQIIYFNDSDFCHLNVFRAPENFSHTTWPEVTNNFLIDSNRVVVLNEEGFHVVQEFFDSIGTIQIASPLNKESNQILVRQQENLFICKEDSVTRLDLRFDDTKFDMALLGSQSAILFMKDSLYIYSLDGALMRQLRIPNYVQSGMDTWYASRRFVYEFTSGVYIYLGKFKELICFDTRDYSFHKVSDLTGIKLPIVSRMRPIKGEKAIALYDSHSVWRLGISDGNSGILSFKKLIQIPDYFEPFDNLFVVPTDTSYLIHDSYFNQTVHEVMKSHKHPIDSLNSFISEMEVTGNEESRTLDLASLPELTYNENDVVIRIETISNYFPETIRYNYQLQGPSGFNWRTTASDSIPLANLDPGDYKFEFFAQNGFEIRSSSKYFSFIIKPPWYSGWWAIVLYVILGLSAILFFIRWRTSKLKQRQKELEREIENATHEIRQQKEQVEEAHKEITDSINYAERIQRSLMASKKLLDENLNDYFIYFNPKEKVSGDFFWASTLENKKFCLVAADSTGHGVPGAIMSMLNISSLEKAVAEKISESSELINFTRKKIIETLANDGSAEGGKDGMDAALLIFNKEKTQLEFSLANNPLWIFRNNELNEYKPDKMPVGKHDKQHIPFTKNVIDLQKGDMIYIFTDGYADQFGGEKGKKFKYSSLKELLLSIHAKPTDEQKMILDVTFENWRGRLEQVDDVCVIGVRV